MERRAEPLVPLVDILGLLEDGVAHALLHLVEVSLSGVVEEALLLVVGLDGGQAGLAGRRVPLASHLDAGLLLLTSS